MPPKAKQAKGPKGKSAYKLAEINAEGLVFTDVHKRQWKIGSPIGSGGFGLIYLCSAVSESSSQDTYYIMKIEPHDNGPLFCELHYYQRAAKPELIEQWKKARKLLHLGVPKYIASGSYEDNRQTKYRFMVMERFGTDLQQVFDKNGQRFPLKTVLLLGLQMLDALEYIHSNGYVHADIKASNILLVDGQPIPQHVYLVDYGLASKFQLDTSHHEYKEDPRKAHDGTVDFTSRDAHKGVKPSRRGDIEILGYCLLQWYSGTLPWLRFIADKDAVRDMKIRYMNDVRSLISACKISDPSDLFFEYFNYVTQLDYKEAPEYDLLRDILRRGLKQNYDTTLVFSETQPVKSASKTGRKRTFAAGASSPGAAATSSGRAKPRASSKSGAARAEVAAASLSAAESSSGTVSSDGLAVKRPRKAVGSTALKSVPVGDARMEVSGGSSLPVTARPVQAKGHSPAAKGRSPAAKGRSPAPLVTSGSSASANGHPMPSVNRAKLVSSASTQTSPSLKGLKARRK